VRRGCEGRRRWPPRISHRVHRVAALQDSPIDDEATPIERRRRDTRIAVAVAVASLAGYLTVRALANPSMIDMIVYRAEGRAVLDGADLYGSGVQVASAGGNVLPATYPPFAALLFAPLAWVPLGVLKVLVTAANITLLGVVVHLAARLLGGRGADRRSPAVAHWAAVLAVTASALWFEPVWTTLRYGQINLALAALVLWDLTRPPGSRWRGVGIGVATGVKLTPAIFILWLLLAGERRHALKAGLSAVGTVAVGFVLLPHDSTRFWRHEVFQTGNVGKTYITDNQALSGALARVAHLADPKALWAVAALVVGVAGLWLAARIARGGDTALGAMCCAVTGLLISPISWSHHWVWAVPVAMLLLRRAPRAAAAWLLVFVSFLIWAVPHRVVGPMPDLNAAQVLLSCLYPLAGLGFLVWAWRSAGRSAPVGSPAEPSPASTRAQPVSAA
jgi:alpha-1,2-mannosyltransferase